jgi:uncharacterized circularly permuted ATP-grasp superfamily protein
MRHHDEMRAADGSIRPHYHEYARWLAEQSDEAIAAKRTEADLSFRRVGITFAVYGDDAGTERLIPFDLIPRIIPPDEWRLLHSGLSQRVRALNRFIQDVYHGHEIVRAGIVPAAQVFTNQQYRPEMQGIRLPGDIWCHIAGIDLVRAGGMTGAEGWAVAGPTTPARAAAPAATAPFYVLEDNLRVPSGVSYMLENRKMMMRLFPDAFARMQVAPVAHYPDRLLENLGRWRRPASRTRWSWC